jgi:hypothetical protein
MYIILSQRKDTKSVYMDKMFSLYHFPRRYKNQIRSGDSFIYYQGDRYSRDKRYYYGKGEIGRIYQTSCDDYYAELIDCYEFTSVVPIYKENGYIEQIDYKVVRNSPNPPWQSSIRPLSDKAAKQILRLAKDLKPLNTASLQTVLGNDLKAAINRYYRESDYSALNDVIILSKQLAGLLGVLTIQTDGDCSNG